MFPYKCFLTNLQKVSKAHESDFINQNNLSDEDFKLLSSMTKEQFRELLQYCDPVPEPNGHRYVYEKDLLAFLCKLRQGLCDDFLRVLFNYQSRQAVSLAVATVRKSLMSRFVPRNIGLTAITRQDYINNHVI